MKDRFFREGWWNSGDRIQDSGAAGVRNVDLTGLDPGVLYYWRLSCPASQRQGELRTAPVSPQ